MRAGIDLGLFDILSASVTPLSLPQIKSVAYHDSILLGECDFLTKFIEPLGANPVPARLLRYLASVGMIKETGKDAYAATNITNALASKGNQAGVRHL